MSLKSFFYNLPEVKKPNEKKLSFNAKLKWTVTILVVFFVLANISLFGLAENSLQRFEYLAIILGTDFGSIISLGIGPIVMASIVLQLLVGSGVINIDTKSPEGRKQFQAWQKIGVLGFIIFEAVVYVVMGGLQANPGYTGIVIFQLILGGLAIMLMDEVTTKWGFGSGVSLFIVAGVAWRLFTSLFQFIGASGENCLVNFSGSSPTACAGNVLIFIQSILNGAPREALLSAAAILITAAIFLLIVWAQSLRVEVPLSFDRLRGYSVKWPLQFFYTSNMPVILASALIANVQLFAGLIANWRGEPTLLGGFSNGVPISGLSFWLGHSNLIESIIRQNLQTVQIYQAISHILIYMVVAAVFSYFWVKTSGMDESSQAKNILSSGLQIPGFRKDPRVLESILSRYILPLTIMGGLAIGFLAGITDTFGALTSGTAILLSVMITYQLYKKIAEDHAVDMHPALKKITG